MQITIEVTQKQLLFVAECLTDDLFYEFGRTVTDCAGVDRKELHEMLTQYKPFRDMVEDAIRNDGVAALDEPYDFMDFDRIYGTKEWARLWDACEEMQAIVHDAEREDTDEADCAAAIKTLKAAGFKITKA
jgi:hypothetical protein